MKPNRHSDCKNYVYICTYIYVCCSSCRCFCGRDGSVYFWQYTSCSMICVHIVGDFISIKLIFYRKIQRRTKVFIWIMKSDQMNLHYLCLEVGQNDHIWVDELVDPIRQTLQSHVTASHKLWTSVTIFCPQKLRKGFGANFYAAWTLMGLLTLQKAISLDGFLEMVNNVENISNGPLTINCTRGRTMLTDLIYIYKRDTLKLLDLKSEFTTQGIQYDCYIIVVKENINLVGNHSSKRSKTVVDLLMKHAYFIVAIATTYFVGHTQGGGRVGSEPKHVFQHKPSI